MRSESSLFQVRIKRRMGNRATRLKCGAAEPKLRHNGVGHVQPPSHHPRRPPGPRETLVNTATKRQDFHRPSRLTDITTPPSVAGSWSCDEWGFPPPRVTAQDTGLEKGVGADIVGHGRKRVGNCEGISGLQLANSCWWCSHKVPEFDSGRNSNLPDSSSVTSE